MSTQTVEFTYKEAMVVLPALEKIAANDKMASHINWRFSKSFAEIKTELIGFEEQRKKVITKYCKKDEKGEPIRLSGNNYQFDPETFVEFEKEVEALLDDTFSISIKKSKISELAPYQLSLMNLEKFIIDEEEKE